MTGGSGRPVGIIGLCLFFAAGSAISLATAVSLLFLGSFLEPMWRLKPGAHEAFSSMGPAAVVLMAAVCLACGLSAIGLCRQKRWGTWLALAVLGTNLVGDAINAIVRSDARTAVGIPIAALLMIYVWRAGARQVTAS